MNTGKCGHRNYHLQSIYIRLLICIYNAYNLFSFSYLLSVKMLKDAQFLKEILNAIRENNLADVMSLWENRARRLERATPFRCVVYTDDRPSRDYQRLVLAAAALEDTAILKYLIQKGFDINAMCAMSCDFAQTITSPLHVAVERGRHESVALLLEANANVNAGDSEGRRSLHLAVKNADCRAARMLLGRGASADVPDRHGTVPLQIAAKYGHVELVRMLLEHDASVFHEGQTGPSPLHIAAMEGHVPLIDMFLNFVDVNTKDTCRADAKEKTPLHLAAARGLVETANFLLERFQADVNALDSDAQTPLQCAVAERHSFRSMRRKEDYNRMADLLIRKCVNVNQQNVRGDTALHLAARNQYYNVVEQLLLSGADPTLLNNGGQTAKDTIPAFDVPMMQLFTKYEAASSSYITVKPARAPM